MTAPIGGPVAVLEERSEGRFVSPHLLDLSVQADGQPKKPARERRRPFVLKQKLDERWHLHDLRMRTLSIRPRGWRDFPPNSSRTVGHAFWLTLVKFFHEHPLAELTTLTVLHLFVVAVWKLATLPFRLIIAAAKRPARDAKTLPLLPLMAVAPATASAPAEMLAAAARPAWSRGLASFAAIASVLVLLVAGTAYALTLGLQKNDIVSRGVRGAELLKAAGADVQGRDFTAARNDFRKALASFAAVRERLGPVGSFALNAASLIPARGVLTSAGPLMTVGEELAAGGADLADGVVFLDGPQDPVSKVAALRSSLERSLPHLALAAKAIDRVSIDSLPEGYRAAATQAKDQLPAMIAGLDRAVAASGLLQDVMGADGTKRYLVVFQNNAELRPTGGFIGSFALVDVSRGQVKKVDIPGGGSYDLKGGLRARVESPQPLHLINPNWEFQDSNWFADFPTSARKISWFYEKSGGPTTDGVIAVNMNLMEKVLDVTGPIAMPEYGKTIDARNFYFETQKAVELEYDKKENKPKKFISDLAPKVMDRILNADRSDALKLIALLDSALSDKELMLWFRDDAIQARNSGLGWSGEILPTEGDYLDVVHTNIAGQKTDLVMQDDIDHSVQVLPDGTGIVTLTIQRTHTGDKNALFTGVRNVDYLRVYVPYGSTLVEASGFSAPDPKLFKIAGLDRGTDPEVAAAESEAVMDKASGVMVSQESGKTVFGNWVQTDPGKTSVVTLVYKLPPGTIKTTALADDRLTTLYGLVDGEGGGQGLTYSLLVQKQPGANPPTFTSRVDLPRGYRLVWQRPERTEDDRGRLSVQQTLNRDALFGAVARTN